MNRDWDKLRRQDRARPIGNAIDSFRPKFSKWTLKRRLKKLKAAARYKIQSL